MISVDEARALVRGHAAPTTEQEEVPLREAIGRVLAAPVRADRDDPPFDRATMDGYAVRAADVASVPVTLQVVGEVAAGDPELAEIGPGEAVRINTGAPLPPGADAVVPIELTDGAGQILESVSTRANVLARGFLASAGEPVVKGRLSPSAIAVCASAGADPVRVLRRPSVALLSTGTELRATPGAHDIRNSNGPMLRALLPRCEVDDLGSVPDDPAELERRIVEGLSRDVLVTTGGVSKGQKDFVPGILAECGVKTVFHRIALQPGKPVLFGVHDHGAVFALPGNPVSALLCADLFLLPFLYVRGGDGAFGAALRETRARMKSAMKASPKRRRVFPCRLQGADVDPLPWRGSADLYTAARANAYVVIEQGQDAAAGDDVACLVPERNAGLV